MSHHSSRSTIILMSAVRDSIGYGVLVSSSVVELDVSSALRVVKVANECVPVVERRKEGQRFWRADRNVFSLASTSSAGYMLIDQA